MYKRQEEVRNAVKVIRNHASSATRFNANDEDIYNFFRTVEVLDVYKRQLDACRETYRTVHASDSGWGLESTVQNMVHHDRQWVGWQDVYKRQA